MFRHTIGVTKSSHALGDTVEQDKYLNKAIRVIFKTADFKHLNPDALEACDIVGVKPESLQLKTVEQFIQSASEPEELAQVRLNHYMNKRKCKCALQLTCLQRISSAYSTNCLLPKTLRSSLRTAQ